MSKLPRHLIAEVLARQSLKPVSSRKLAREIAAYLISQHRTADLESLLRDILQYRADNGIVEVRAISAHPLNDRLRQDIRVQIQSLYPAARRIIIDEEYDEMILGSVRLELANQQFDASIRTKLNRFKQLAALGKG